ncbi:MAG: threonine synthase, partial [bacterium]
VCTGCGKLKGTLDVIYDYEVVAKEFMKEKLRGLREFSHWRYLPILPVEKEFIPPINVGFTPLYRIERLNKYLGVENLYIKDDGRNPSASLKDRASSVGVAKALEKGRRIITAASTGNAAASLANICATVGLDCRIFVPKTAPQPKIAQLLVFGAKVYAVNGTYDQAFELCLEATEKLGWYSRNTGFNPYMCEGKKTVILEIMEELNWNPPERIFVSVGDGCIISSVYKGLFDLFSLSWIDRYPRIYGVQAEGAAPLYKAWKENKNMCEPMVPKTFADSISVGIPRDQVKALRAVRKTNGGFIAVPDDSIREAINILARYAGVFAEPAGAAAFAGFLDMLSRNEIDKKEKVVVLVTGGGLKDPAGATSGINEKIIEIEPSFSSLQQYL